MNSAQVSIVDQQGALLEASDAATQAAGEDALPAVSVSPDVAAVEPAAKDAVQASPPEKPAQLPKPAAPRLLDSLNVNDELLPVYAGLAIALLMFIFLLRLRARQRKQREQEEALAARGPQAGEIFDARLDALRQQVLSDPKVTASVVKIWLNP